MKKLSFKEFRSRALDAGFLIAPFHNPPDLWSIAMELGRREEREACAGIVEQAGEDGYGTLAAAVLIRQRSEKGESK